MTNTSGDQLGRWVQIVLVAVIALLLAEVHQLRTAVEAAELTRLESGTASRVPASLERPLVDLARRMDALNRALAHRSVLPASPPSDGNTPETAEPRAGKVTTREAREPLPTDWDARFTALIASLERLEAIPRVTTASLPPPRANARGMQEEAVAQTIAALHRSPEQQSRMLMMTRDQLLDRFGKPNSISLGEKDQRGKVRWWEELRGSTGWLAFDLYDGRVIKAETTD